MRLFLTILGNILFHLVFGVAFLGGAAGVAAIINFWPKKEPDEGNLLLAVGILSGAVAAAGALGITKFRDKAVRALDAETDLAPLQSVKPISNVLSGLAIMIVSALAVWYQMRVSGLKNVIEIPVVALACGVLQFGYGLWQLIARIRHG